MTSTETVNPYPTVAAETTNTPGRASLVLGIVIVVIGVVQQVVVQLVPFILASADLPASSIGLIFGVFTIVVALIAVVGLILGIVGLGRTAAPRLAAAAGTALSASALLGAVFALMLPLILGAVL